MANYNPHAPRIIGQEWVPIRNENQIFSPAVDIVEVGHGFTTATNRTIQDGRFYINTPAPTIISGQSTMIAIYPAGTEDLSGPIRSVVIPVNNGGVTGAGIVLNFASTVAEALLSPSDGKAVDVSPTGSPQYLSMFFAVNAYPGLSGKRILGISFEYATWGSYQTFSQLTSGVDPVSLYTTNNTGFSQAAWYGSLVGAENLSTMTPGSVDLGELNPHWSTFGISDAMPWRYVDLQRFEASSSNRLFAWLQFQLPTGTVVSIDYAALRVFYCEEQRIIYGGKSYLSGDQIIGANPIPLRDLTQTANPILAPGAYTVTLSSANVGNYGNGNARRGSYPLNNALRELYALSDIPGLQVNIPQPLTNSVGDTFTKETTHVLPQLTLHTSGGPLPEVHVYGRQAVAPVYGSITATQNILDANAGAAATWPWVRYYARRFGNTTIPLVLDSPSITGSSVSLSVTAFDALDEIVDGWKEISLRFSSPPTMGAGTNPTWRWSATGEIAGDRWEVLGAIAPAISGIPGDLLHEVVSTQRLGSATYGEPSAGTTIELTWLTPTVTATVADPSADAVLIFAQDLPAVTGFGVTGLIQTLTGIGEDCGSVPCCVPDGLLYNRVTWSATSGSVPASGFGFYELQRMDPVTDWMTIMQYSSPAATGFSDYEARVGLLTSYRIRAVDVYGFYNDWSSTITITTAAPGITGGDCVSQGHVLIFTSNERQDGSVNLGYASVWESNQVVEDFAFPEAGFTQLQPMYGRDFFTAFRPTERGGSRFTRTVLVQSAAISPETLPDFTDLRDMAWDTVSYICVRDEDGNRWLSNVNVPSGRVLLNRSIYLAPVEIAEVTSTPSPVDPAA